MYRHSPPQPSYISDRETRSLHQYGIRRRAAALVQGLARGGEPESGTILDIGTADGRVLQRLVERFDLTAIGLDLTWQHLQAARGRIRNLIQADGRRLPLAEASLEIVISTATFKHVAGLDRLVAECARVLKPGGRLAVIDPTPWGLRLALWLRHLPRESIFQILNREELLELLQQHGFLPLFQQRFMLLPFPFPGDERLERLLLRVGLDRLLLYQLVCVARTSGPTSGAEPGSGPHQADAASEKEGET